MRPRKRVREMEFIAGVLISLVLGIISGSIIGKIMAELGYTPPLFLRKLGCKVLGHLFYKGQCEVCGAKEKENP